MSLEGLSSQNPLPHHTLANEDANEQVICLSMAYHLNNAQSVNSLGLIIHNDNARVC